ncbi:hypothetical protein DUI87_00508 [Hirundo rustica rustica]|uniref:Uncharacterized protein n=1 Tax=Hirundo rustica rustica TaxID=333673 RepID=A0A3M0LAS6_HIRRU|nr:hypothetical protein DUI87_00508 [Hirundo rustica rustica]
MVGGDPYCCELLLHDHARLGCVDENGWQEIHQVDGILGNGIGTGNGDPPGGTGSRLGNGNVLLEPVDGAGRRSTRWDGIPPPKGMGLALGMFSWSPWMEIHQVGRDPASGMGMFSWSPWMGLAGDPPGGTGSYLGNGIGQGNVLLVPVDGDPPGGTGSRLGNVLLEPVDGAGRRSTRWDGIPGNGIGQGNVLLEPVDGDPPGGTGSRLRNGIGQGNVLLVPVDGDPPGGMGSYHRNVLLVSMVGDPPGGMGSCLGNVLLVPVDGAGRRSTRWDGIPPPKGMGLAKGMFSWSPWMEIHQVGRDPALGMFSWCLWMGLAGDPPGGTGSRLGNVLLVSMDGAGRRSTRWDGILGNGSAPGMFSWCPWMGLAGDPPGGMGSMGMGSAPGMFSWCSRMDPPGGVGFTGMASDHGNVVRGWDHSVPEACRYGHVQHLEHLLFYGADMAAQNASGNTALHICALYNQESCARVLLFRGASKEIRNYNSQTAFQVAIIAGNFELAEIIKTHKESDVVPFRETPSYTKRRRLLGSGGLASPRLLQRSASDNNLKAESRASYSPVPSLRSLPPQLLAQMQEAASGMPASGMPASGMPASGDGSSAHSRSPSLQRVREEREAEAPSLRRSGRGRAGIRAGNVIPWIGEVWKELDGVGNGIPWIGEVWKELDGVGNAIPWIGEEWKELDGVGNAIPWIGEVRKELDGVGGGIPWIGGVWEGLDRGGNVIPWIGRMWKELDGVGNAIPWIGGVWKELELGMGSHGLGGV